MSWGFRRCRCRVPRAFPRCRHPPGGVAHGSQSPGLPHAPGAVQRFPRPGDLQVRSPWVTPSPSPAPQGGSRTAPTWRDGGCHQGSSKGPEYSQPGVPEGQRALGQQEGPWASPAFSLPSSEVTHVVMEQMSAEEAGRWQECWAAAAPPGCPFPALLDVSWFTDSMTAGQPVPVEQRHRLEVSWYRVASRAGPSQLGAAGSFKSMASAALPAGRRALPVSPDCALWPCLPRRVDTPERQQRQACGDPCIPAHRCPSPSQRKDPRGLCGCPPMPASGPRPSITTTLCCR